MPEIALFGMGRRLQKIAYEFLGMCALCGSGFATNSVFEKNSYSGAHAKTRPLAAGRRL